MVCCISVVVAANAGGAFSTFGDITTLMVWQQGKQDYQNYGDFSFNRDFGGVFSAPAHNVFLVKFSYWLNM